MKNDMALTRPISNPTKLVIRARESPLLLQNKTIDTESVFLDAFVKNHESSIRNQVYGFQLKTEGQRFRMRNASIA